MPTLTNPKWERFAQELSKGKTADEAYQIAGYKENRHNASRLKTTETISNRVAELLGKGAERAEMSRQWVLDHLKMNALAALGERLVRVVTVNADGETIEKEVTMIDRGAANRALELLGKELLMFIERHEVGAAGEFAALSDDALADAIAAKLTEVGILPAETKH